jgi:hypothetical protein
MSAPTVTQGVPVEEISTDTMARPRAPAHFGNRSIQVVQQQMASPLGEGASVALNSVVGLLLPAYAYATYWQYGSRPCDQPVAGWLSTYALLGFAIGTTGLCMRAQAAALRSSVQRAEGLRGEARAEALMPAVGATGTIGCAACCCHLPLHVINVFWWISGNFAVWGTAKRTDISADEPVSTFKGCDAELLQGARNVYVATYIILGIGLCAMCMLCGHIAAHAEVAASTAQQRQQAKGMV